MATFLHGDCLELMKTLPDKSIDCFICDLPYGQVSCAWDSKINLEEFWKQVKRLCKDDHTPVLMFCNTKFGYELIKSNEKWFRYDLVWDKGRGVSFLLANKMPMKSHEMIYVFSKAGSYYKRIDIEGVYKEVKRELNAPDCNSKVYGVTSIHSTNTSATKRCALSIITSKGTSATHGNHPTEKSKELYKWLLERYCPKGGTVLDPTAGSFNSISAARELGLKAIGIEKDTTFFWSAIKNF